MKINKKSKFAFSLIELSIVIVVIGLLVIAVANGSRIMSESRIKAAQSLTKGSAAAATEGMLAWFEASDSSFIKSSTVSAIATTSYGNVNNNNLVSQWKDRNPQSPNYIELSAETSDSRRPTYITNGINNIPSISFDASVGNYLISRGNAPIGSIDSSYSYFLVVKTTATPTNGVVMGQGPTTTGTPTAGRGTGIYFTTAGNIVFWGDSSDSTITSFSLNKPYIIGVLVDNSKASNNVSLYLNSTTAISVTDSPSTLKVAPDIFSVGRIAFSSPGTNYYYKGLVSELIFFDHYLKTSELTGIQCYLSNKYKITISNISC